MCATEAPVLVLTAIPEELKPLLKRLRAAAAGRVEGRRVFRIGAAGARPSLVLSSTGDGSRNAAGRMGRLCEVYEPKAVVGLGAAGALTSSLAALDLVASGELQNGSGAVPAPDEALLSRALAAGARRATLVTTPAPISSVSSKKRLADRLGAQTPAAVDMESAAWARAAAGAGIPFVVVRAISDTADEELPAYLSECVGPEGGIQRRVVLARALRRPSTIPELVRMRRRVVECGQRLSDFLLDGFFG